MAYQPWNFITVIGLVAVAIVEAVNEATGKLPKELNLPDWLTAGWLHFLPLVLLILLGILSVVRVFLSSGKGKLRLEILAPTDGAQVNLMRTVRGASTHLGVPIQLFVYPADHKWWP